MDKTIDDLLAAEAVTADDLFVVQQNATAKKVSGDTLRRYVGQESDLPKPTVEGAFLRVRDKKWVAETSPVFIDLYSAGVNADPSQLGNLLSFDVSTDIVTQIVAAAKNGEALLKFGFVYGQRLPVQAYVVGIALETVESYQLSGRAYFDSKVFDIFFNANPQDNNAQILSACTIAQPLLPKPSDDGAFLRWSGEQNKWVAETVPAAEGGTF